MLDGRPAPSYGMPADVPGRSADRNRERAPGPLPARLRRPAGSGRPPVPRASHRGDAVSVARIESRIPAARPRGSPPEPTTVVGASRSSSRCPSRCPAARACSAGVSRTRCTPRRQVREQRGRPRRHRWPSPAEPDPRRRRGDVRSLVSPRSIHRSSALSSGSIRGRRIHSRMRTTIAMNAAITTNTKAGGERVMPVARARSAYAAGGTGAGLSSRRPAAAAPGRGSTRRRG